ncbi:unnamed protein product [Closterium sp. Naga37s-1]|nr:unnamed protein product [Closterium sp. Naga37s-1]
MCSSFGAVCTCLCAVCVVVVGWWQTVLERWNFSETTWGNVFLACVADVLHVLDGGFLGHMVDEFISPLSKPERRELQRRKKEQKKDTRSTVVRIPGGSSWFKSRANYAAFENRGMMQVMPLLIADNMEGCEPEEKEQRFKEVRAFRRYAVFYKSLLGVNKHTERTLSDVRQYAYTMVDAVQDAFQSQASAWNLPKVHQIIHLIDGIMLRGMPFEYSTNLWEHTCNGTVKVPVRGSNWKDIPRRIVEEEVQREITREVAALAGGGRQYVSALREAVILQTYVLTRKSRNADVSDGEDAVLWAYKEALGSDMKELGRCLAAAGVAGTAIKVHTAVAIPRTRGGELVAKGTFVKASPSEMWFSDVAVRAKKDKEEWYARCLCVFRATDASGDGG